MMNCVATSKSEITEISDNIHKMNTVCSCGRGADFNVRKDRYGNYVTQGEQIVIDDHTKVEYEGVCGKCYLRLRRKLQ